MANCIPWTLPSCSHIRCAMGWGTIGPWSASQLFQIVLNFSTCAATCFKPFICPRSSDYWQASFWPDQQGDPAYLVTQSGSRAAQHRVCECDGDCPQYLSGGYRSSWELWTCSQIKGHTERGLPVFFFLYKQISATQNACIRSFCPTCLIFPFLLFLSWL